MKRLIYTFTIGLALLSACSTPVENETTNETEESQEDETVETTEEMPTEDEMAPASDEEIEQAESISEFTDYPELVHQNVFNPEDYDAWLVTDNPGTRVFIFRDGEQQAYKTVFIKSDNRLKLIDIANNELLLNERIN